MKVLRQRDVPEEKYSNAFLGFGAEESHFVVELTYSMLLLSTPHLIEFHILMLFNYMFIIVAYHGLLRTFGSCYMEAKACNLRLKDLIDMNTEYFHTDLQIME